MKVYPIMTRKSRDSHLEEEESGLTKVATLMKRSLEEGIEESTNLGPKKAKSKEHGNYDRYYGYRKPQGGEKGSKLEDVRLDVLKEEWFRGKDHLDVGCNTGSLVVQIARRFRPKKVMAVDVDENLIKQAKGFLQERKRDGREYLESIEFRHEDFVGSAAEVQEAGGRYDIISCFSVSKWVHLQHGDKGLHTLFRRAYHLLRDDGCFILEPQPWKSYRRRKYLSEKMYQNFKEIKTHPVQFPDYLKNHIGFSVVENLGVPEGAPKGFNRCIYACWKGMRTKPSVGSDTLTANELTT